MYQIVRISSIGCKSSPFSIWKLLRSVWIGSDKLLEGMILFLFSCEHSLIGRDVDRKTRNIFPDSKVHGANMGPTWILTAPDGPHDGPRNLSIRVLSAGVGLGVAAFGELLKRVLWVCKLVDSVHIIVYSRNLIFNTKYAGYPMENGPQGNWSFMHFTDVQYQKGI